MQNNQLNNCFTSAMIGDAVGFHVECANAPQVEKLTNLIRNQQEQLNLASLNEFELKDWITGRLYTSGQITDDTQSMLALMTAISQNPEAPYTDFAHNMLKLFKDQSIVAYGHTTKNAMLAFEKQGDWETCGDKERITNGSAMRVAPLGVLYKDDMVKLIEASCLQSKVTHSHPIAQLSSLALATAVACAANGQIKNEEIMSAIMHNFVKAQQMFHFSDDDVAIFIPLVNRGYENIEDAHESILAMDRHQKEQDYGISTFAPTCVFWSIACFYLNPENFWECVADSISIGGDTDTVATMSAALHGAYKKTDGLERFSAWLHNHGEPISLPL